MTTKPQKYVHVKLVFATVHINEILQNYLKVLILRIYTEKTDIIGLN